MDTDTDTINDPVRIPITEFGRIGYLRRHRDEIEGQGTDLSALAEVFAAWDRVEAELYALHRALEGVVIPGLLPVEDEAGTAVPKENIKQHKIMPLFVFQRRHEVELEGGYILAGQMFVDVPKGTKPNAHQKRMIEDILHQLAEAARSGKLAHDAVCWGWPGDVPPPDADEIKRDNALMDAWSNERLIVAVRVGKDFGGSIIPVDSDLIRQMGRRGTRDH